MQTNFDLMCTFAEKTAQKNPSDEVNLILSLLRDARLFEIESAEPRVPASDEEIKLMGDDFRLPFDIVAVEDASSCVLIADRVPGQVGLGRERIVIYGMAREEKGVVGGAVIQSAQVKENGNFVIGVRPETAFVCPRINGVWQSVFSAQTMMPEPVFQGLAHDLNVHFSAALREILLTNVPANFIMESSPLKSLGPGKRIPRSHERPNYTLLRPGEIRRRMHLPEPTGDGSTKAPHERRAHFRTLRDERYTRNSDGSPRTIWIPATWVGPTESVVGQRRYRVILD